MQRQTDLRTRHRTHECLRSPVRHSLSRKFLALAAVLVLASCAGPQFSIGSGENQLQLAAETGATVQKLFVATTRERSADPAEFYSGERSRRTRFANVAVTIPPLHKVGEIEQPKSDERDINKHFTIAKPLILDGRKDFKAALNAELAKRPKGERKLLLFVHGYNTNFSDAVLRAAQFAHDTGFKGIPVLFSWASRGKTLDYVYDLNSALQSRFYLAEFASVLTESNAESLDIVAHSMGNLATLEAMSELEGMHFRSRVPLNNVVLAAPDVDFDLFVEHIKILKRLRSKIFVLISSDDKALGLSRVISGGVDRAGDAHPDALAALGLNVIDLSQVHDKDNVHHSKFADSPEIVQLIGRGINSGNTLSTSNTGSTQARIGQVFQGFRRVPSRLLGGRGQGGVLTLGD